MKLVAVLLTAGLLVGCASTPKPQMTEDQYEAFGRLKALIKNCHTEGLLSLELAAIGDRHTNATIDEFTYDPQKIALKTYYNDRYMATPERCNPLAIQYEQIRQNFANSARLPSFQSPRTTSCNTVFGNTVCNTF